MSAVAITMGRGLAIAQGQLFEIADNDPPVVALARVFTDAPQAFESWWTPHTYTESYRSGERWIASSGVAVDVDFDGKPERRPPPELARRARDLISDGMFPGCICYFTPSGIRLVFPFAAMSADRRMIKRACVGACLMVEKSLRAHGLIDEKRRDGYHVDYAASCDLARLFFLPNAIVKGVRRDAPAMVMRTETYAPEDLARLAPADVEDEPAPAKEATAKSTVLAEAIKAYNDDRPRQWPKSSGDCPACGHRECFGTLPKSDGRRWACFSANHTRVGVKGEGCWHGDALDLDAHAEGITTRDFLIREGYLIEETASNDGIASIDERRRPLRSRSYLTAVAIISGNKRDVLQGRKLELNEMTGRPELGREPMMDADTHRIRALIELLFPGGLDANGNEKGMQIAAGDVFAAVEQVANANRYHSVREYLRQVEWDGIERLDAMAEDLLGAANTLLNRAIMRRFMISAVARAMEPGCKVDTVLVLVGPQGCGKSTFFRTLAGRWFIDSPVDIYNKDSFQVLRAAWIYEWAELEVLRRAKDAAAAKAFISSAVDTYRPSHARLVVDVPRSGVIVGSTNNDEFLTDDTGNRRFWPLRTGYIDVKAVGELRDQLWAEAVKQYTAGEPWWLTQEEGAELSARHQEHVVRDPWDEVIWAWAAKRVAPFSAADVLDDALDKRPGQWEDRDLKRVVRSLKRGGYIRDPNKPHRGPNLWWK